jgi:hypothetical protein
MTKGTYLDSIPHLQKLLSTTGLKYFTHTTNQTVQEDRIMYNHFLLQRCEEENAMWGAHLAVIACKLALLVRAVAAGMEHLFFPLLPLAPPLAPVTHQQPQAPSW